MTTECECGNVKSSSAEACRRCAYLDGERRINGLVIDALRGTNGLSLRELCEEIHGESTTSRRTAMLRTMQSLEERHRVRRYWVDGDAFEIAGWRRGPATRITRGATGHWAYALDGMTEREWRAA